MNYVISSNVLSQNKLKIVLTPWRSGMEIDTFFHPTIKSGIENLSHSNTLWRQWFHDTNDIFVTFSLMINFLTFSRVFPITRPQIFRGFPTSGHHACTWTQAADYKTRSSPVWQCCWLHHLVITGCSLEACSLKCRCNAYKTITSTSVSYIHNNTANYGQHLNRVPIIVCY